MTEPLDQPPHHHDAPADAPPTGDPPATATQDAPPSATRCSPTRRRSPVIVVLAAATAITLTAGLWIWQAEGGSTPTGHDDGVRSVAFSPDGDTLATASGDGADLIDEVP